MQIQKNESKRIVSIWLTQNDQDNPVVLNILPELLYSLRQEHYSPVIFRSGREDLYESMFQLLRHNREAAIREEMRSVPACR